MHADPCVWPRHHPSSTCPGVPRPPTDYSRRGVGGPDGTGKIVRKTGVGWGTGVLKWVPVVDRDEGSPPPPSSSSPKTPPWPFQGQENVVLQHKRFQQQGTRVVVQERSEPVEDEVVERGQVGEQLEEDRYPRRREQG